MDLYCQVEYPEEPSAPLNGDRIYRVGHLGPDQISNSEVRADLHKELDKVLDSKSGYYFVGQTKYTVADQDWEVRKVMGLVYELSPKNRKILLMRLNNLIG